MTEELYYHNSKYNLYLAPSQIPNAGLGVYTKDFIAANSHIDEYIGEMYTFHPGGGYVLEYESGYYIDARKYPRCYMGMINDCEFISKKIIKKKKRRVDITPDAYYDKNNNKLFTNCEFINKLGERKVYVVSTRDIQPESELFISYGREYWYN
jgi:hypothetical protein